MRHRRSIRAVYRVQCGKCNGWLSRSPDYVVGTDVLPRHQVVAPTAEHAFNWPGERSAYRAALDAGWTRYHTRLGDLLLCPSCSANPLGIVLPPDPCPNCLHVHRGSAVCGSIMTGYPCCCMNQKPKENRQWTT